MQDDDDVADDDDKNLEVRRLWSVVQHGWVGSDATDDDTVDIGDKCANRCREFDVAHRQNDCLV